MEQQYHETYQGPEQNQSGSMEIPLAQLMQMEQEHRNGASWFYWVSALSVLSSILMLIGSKIISALTLASTEFLTGLGMYAPELLVFALIPYLFIIGAMVLIGYLSKKGSRIAYLLGIIFLALDTLVLVWALDIIGILFHALVLYYLIRGYIALSKLKKLVPKN
jgi:hypothetical protein